MKRAVLILAALVAAACGSRENLTEKYAKFLTTPNGYVCVKTDVPPVIDGSLSDGCWQKAAFNSEFHDISGEGFPEPYRNTKVKMLWDNDFLYIGAELEEPFLQGVIAGRDEVIWKDNDFEVFLDPDGDGRNYYEIELNALGTVFDLFLEGSYRCPERPYIMFQWDCQGLVSAVKTTGTLNDGSDTDTGWTVELAIPQKAIVPEFDKLFAAGNYMRVGFSRVEWQWENGAHKNGEDGKPLPEFNWTWGPTGMIAMHMPERWGYVWLQEEPCEFEYPALMDAEKLLWTVFYAQEEHFSKTGKYMKDVPLSAKDRELMPAGATLSTEVWTHGYKTTMLLPGGNSIAINEAGKLYR